VSEKNVEIVRGHIEAFLHDAATALSSVDPAVVFDRSRVGALESEIVFGHEAVVTAVRQHVGTFEEYAYELERLTDLGPSAVLAVVTETGRGKGSGVPVRRSIATLYTVIGGKIVRMTVFRSEQEALEAAGLAE
jgi:ketosteroid isomerase-like protein